MTDRLTELQTELALLVRERAWERFHDPKNLSMLIASEAGELVAEYRWVRSEDADRVTDDANARARVQGEVADVAIGLLNLCRRLDVDLIDVVRSKLEEVRLKYPIGTGSEPLDRSHGVNAPESVRLNDPEASP